MWICGIMSCFLPGGKRSNGGQTPSSFTSTSHWTSVFLSRSPTPTPTRRLAANCYFRRNPAGSVSEANKTDSSLRWRRGQTAPHPHVSHSSFIPQPLFVIFKPRCWRLHNSPFWKTSSKLLGGTEPCKNMQVLWTFEFLLYYSYKFNITTLYSLNSSVQPIDFQKIFI